MKKIFSTAYIIGVCLIVLPVLAHETMPVHQVTGHLTFAGIKVISVSKREEIVGCKTLHEYKKMVYTVDMEIFFSSSYPDNIITHVHKDPKAGKVQIFVIGGSGPAASPFKQRVQIEFETSGYDFTLYVHERGSVLKAPVWRAVKNF